MINPSPESLAQLAIEVKRFNDLNGRPIILPLADLFSAFASGGLQIFQADGTDQTTAFSDYLTTIGSTQPALINGSDLLLVSPNLQVTPFLLSLQSTFTRITIQDGSFDLLGGCDRIALDIQGTAVVATGDNTLVRLAELSLVDTASYTPGNSVQHITSFLNFKSNVIFGDTEMYIRTMELRDSHTEHVIDMTNGYLKINYVLGVGTRTLAIDGGKIDILKVAEVNVKLIGDSIKFYCGYVTNGSNSFVIEDCTNFEVFINFALVPDTLNTMSITNSYRGKVYVNGIISTLTITDSTAIDIDVSNYITTANITNSNTIKIGTVDTLNLTIVSDLYHYSVKPTATVVCATTTTSTFAGRYTNFSLDINSANNTIVGSVENTVTNIDGGNNNKQSNYTTLPAQP